MVDALVAKAEEGRRRQRNTSGSCQQILIRRCPNRETSVVAIRLEPMQIGWVSRGTETSKYPEEKKKKLRCKSENIPLVAVSENGKVQTSIY